MTNITEKLGIIDPRITKITDESLIQKYNSDEDFKRDRSAVEYFEETVFYGLFIVPNSSLNSESGINQVRTGDKSKNDVQTLKAALDADGYKLRTPLIVSLEEENGKLKLEVENGHHRSKAISMYDEEWPVPVAIYKTVKNTNDRLIVQLRCNNHHPKVSNKKEDVLHSLRGLNTACKEASKLGKLPSGEVEKIYMHCVYNKVNNQSISSQERGQNIREFITKKLPPRLRLTPGWQNSTYAKMADEIFGSSNRHLRKLDDKSLHEYVKAKWDSTLVKGRSQIKGDVAYVFSEGNNIRKTHAIIESERFEALELKNASNTLRVKHATYSNQYVGKANSIKSLNNWRKDYIDKCGYRNKYIKDVIIEEVHFPNQLRSINKNGKITHPSNEEVYTWDYKTYKFVKKLKI